ncbi:8026_t:CDS:2, partial [Entrophospora sp. SA101]
LAQKDYFQDRAFLNYLNIGNDPEYAKNINMIFLKFTLIDLKKQDIATEIHSKQYHHWMAWRNIDVNVRLRLFESSQCLISQNL